MPTKIPRRTKWEDKRFACQFTYNGVRSEVRFATRKGAQNYANRINGGMFGVWKPTDAIVVDVVGLEKLAATIRQDVLGQPS